METIIKRVLKSIKIFKKTSNNIRIKNKIKHTFITMAKKAVIGLQTPSYTSATHTWQGNAEILNKKAKNIKIKLNFTSKIDPSNKELPR
jgi:hypothetical protein